MHARYLIITCLAFLSMVASSARADAQFTIQSIDNPAYRSNELFRAFENYCNSRLRTLREAYKLDDVVRAETDEFRRIILLRHWIHNTMPIDDYSTLPAVNPLAILEAARTGGKFNCTHFAVVQEAVLNSFGYITRTIGVGPGKNPSGIDGHHATNEVWVDTLRKWVMVDAKYDLQFGKNGIPLSALEIRDEVWRNGARDVVAAFGPEGKPTVPQINDRDWGIWATPQIYRWVSWNLNTNRFATYPANAPSSVLIMYDDGIFKKNVWYRDGKPFWAYGTPYLIKTTRRSWIYWTPNTIISKTTISGNHVRIMLESFTPNFRTYQVRADGEPWQNCGPAFEFDAKDDHHELRFRAVNRFGVSGPEHRIEIDRK
jgi:Transglutaminase-like superfamily